ncbi:hypothetical protein BH23VER1_BH23VER1_06020 [soil metagenome]
MPTKLLFLDCDSTLSSIEGVDELASFRSADVLAQVEALTSAAMEGEIPIGEVFARRLELIRPTRAECAAIGQRYIDTVEPDAARVVAAAQRSGWRPIILSGGFVPAILPLAAHLGIATLEAVPLHFAPDGTYTGFGHDFPTTRNGGKSEVIESYRARSEPARIAMVGDGVSDLETRPVVDLFVGFGRYAEREVVRNGAHAYITALSDLPPLLDL